jgi:signal transduction histidine kinase
VTKLEADLARSRLELQHRDLEIRRLRAEISRANRLEPASDVADRIAHAICSPLASLVGTAEMRAGSEAGADPHWTRVVRLGKRIRTTVHRMLDLSRDQTPKLARVNPHQLLEDLEGELTDACKGANVELWTRVAPDLTWFLADGNLVLVALASIAENAVEAVDGQGEIVIEVERVHVRGSEHVALRVSDNGCGVPAELRERVLEPFFTTRANGAGLGLAITQAIATDHGGRIRIDDNPGGGTIVTLEIPLVD